MSDHASVIHTYAIALALVFGLSTIAYATLIWLALKKKDFVKATVWYRKSGFSLEARSSRARRTEE